MSEDKRQPTDLQLFREALADVEPLPQQRVEPYRAHRSPYPLERPTDAPPEPESASFSDPELELEAGDILDFARPGIQRRVMRDLRRGRLKVGMELDLHGLSVPHARTLLGRFIQECQYRGVRCARIIHGKGFGSQGRQPVLKQRLNGWLRQHQEVLAFTSATRRDGGTGAAYVLLRKPRRLPGDR